ncbi:NrfD/PsrC family molybdoenzyme membrane anchor subunit [Amycolatopsis rhabdoformis]|uniref:NrfD/PsrC family molybdoenzyme membrane anchor subunit n=1 Tax=Amycolatopsis rhabdoformis TaxID=1448059 RepID=A0ABZ1IM75_9PSEU|nr:NrfD/PsrC family molybdoenzyme membrane anchor subunit [Amycolatopsis rhabdoformis]WSE34654.1 NrfD/PsrC family molybdoenzyme membrane anchor subunit [Amycolatopsis rhabdoformis]
MSPRAERSMVDRAEFTSYYGRPILKEPAWKQPDVPLYLFLGGLAGSSASMSLLAELTGRPKLAHVAKLAAAGGASASVVALVHDLGKPTRFLHMLRVFKPTSPLSVGSWILAPFSGVAAVSAASAVTGVLPGIGRLAGIAAGLLGPAMCTYTAVLLSDTATPSWHAAHGDLPILFAGSALTSGAGVALLAAPASETGPVVRAALVGTAAELIATHRLETGLGLVSEPYRTGRAGRLLKAARALTAVGAGLSLAARRSRPAAVAGGVAFLAAGLCTRFGVYQAGVESAKDPKYVVIPQRARMAERDSS